MKVGGFQCSKSFYVQNLAWRITIQRRLNKNKNISFAFSIRYDQKDKFVIPFAEAKMRLCSQGGEKYIQKGK